MSDINKTLNSLDEKDKKIKQFSDILDEFRAAFGFISKRRQY
jgi:hypothetical protein